MTTNRPTKLDNGEPMYETPPKPADLDALDALHAAAGLAELFSSHIVNDGYTHLANLTMAPDKPCFCIMHRKEVCDWFAALHNAYPAIAAELRALREEVVNLKDDLCDAEELASEAKKRCAAEWEKDCAAALRSLAEETNFQWDPDSDPADNIREHIQITLEEYDGAVDRLRAEIARLRERVKELEAKNEAH